MREVLIPLGNGASTLSAYGIAAGDVARFVEVETALRAPFDDAALSLWRERGLTLVTVTTTPRWSAGPSGPPPCGTACSPCGILPPPGI